MSSSSWLVCAALTHALLPFILATGVVLRQNGMSVPYLVFLFIGPWIATPNAHNLPRSTATFLKVVLGWSSLCFLSQVCFQIVLLSLPPYGQRMPYCSFWETVYRHIGYVRLDGVGAWAGIRILMPDLVIGVASLVIWRVCVKQCNPPQNLETGGLLATSHIFAEEKIAKIRAYSSVAICWTCVGALGVVACLRPSVTAVPYFVAFLVLCTLWAWRINWTKAWPYLTDLLAALTAIHCFLLFVYQAAWPKELLPPSSIYARLFGLVAFTTEACHDPRESILVELPWTDYVYPIGVLVLYHTLVYGKGVSEALPSPTSIAQQSIRMPLEALRNHAFQNSQTDESLHTIVPDAAAAEGGKEKWMKLLQRTWVYLSIVPGLIVQSAYVVAIVAMMAWSITYHSWLTFVLLIWSCALWIMPKQRVATLQSMPALVSYSLFLLLAQYLYCLNLTDDELPVQVSSVNLGQIGFVKNVDEAYKPLLTKIVYTIVFWLTLRQYEQERQIRLAHERARRSFGMALSCTGNGMIVSGLVQQVQLPPKDALDRPNTSPAWLVKFGAALHRLLVRVWIWVVAIMLFIIGIGQGEHVVLYRILYMALFLVFVLTFQLSYTVWRRLLYPFWLTVIIYSMVVLVLVYTYQFDHFTDHWEQYLKIPEQLQNDIGLEVYDTGTLFLRLLTPTFFVVITAVQLHYFHQEFLDVSDLEKKKCPPSGSMEGLLEEHATDEAEAPEPPGKAPEMEEDETITEKLDSSIFSSFTFRKLKESAIILAKKWFALFQQTFIQLVELAWRFLDLHMMKIVFLSLLLLSVYDVCILHYPFCIAVVLSVPSRFRYQKWACRASAGWACFLFLARMIYQIDYIDHQAYDINCTWSNGSFYAGNTTTLNLMEWIGFRKSAKLPELLKGYIGLILVLTIQAVIQIRQGLQGVEVPKEGKPGVLFEGVTRFQADEGLIQCSKFLMNFGFYKFGIEICLVTMVGVLGSRLDIYSLIYAGWLCYLYRQPRPQLARVWPALVICIAVCLGLQYFLCLGLPPVNCLEYPWDVFPKLRDWLFLPDFVKPPESYKLVTDFILLALCSGQWVIFCGEPFAYYAEAGTNSDLGPSPEKNPLGDFLTGPSKCWLDIMKAVVCPAMYWMALSVMFLAGTNRVNAFAIGYLLASFLFLWKGNEFFLWPRHQVLHWWNALVGYNVAVMTGKAFLQLIGCAFITQLQINACWLVQIWGIACLQKFGVKVPLNLADFGDCPLPTDEAGMFWDGVCFACLLFSRRLFGSYYFSHVVNEIKAQNMLASRGAELIAALAAERIREQEEEEKRILDSIREKMDRIKATQQRLNTHTEPQDHYKAGSREPCSTIPSRLSLAEEGVGFVSQPPSASHAHRFPHFFGEDTRTSSITPSPSPFRPISPSIAAIPCSVADKSLTRTAGAGSPSSAAYSFSLEGYCEQRMSLYTPQGTAPASPLPFDESIMGSHSEKKAGPTHVRHHSQPVSSMVFPLKPPPTPRRRSSLRRRSFAASPAGVSHHTSIRSGDYHLFTDDELLASVSGVKMAPKAEEEDCGDTLSLGRLVSSALRHGIEEATDRAERRSDSEGLSVPAHSPTHSRRVSWSIQVPHYEDRSHSNRTSAVFDDNPVEYAESEIMVERLEHTLREDSRDEEDHDDFFGEDHEADHEDIPRPAGLLGKIEGAVAMALRKMWVMLRFGIAFVNSSLSSAANHTDAYCYDYRYVINTLTKEKSILKAQLSLYYGDKYGVSDWDLHSAINVFKQLSYAPPPESKTQRADTPSPQPVSRPCDVVEIRIECASVDGRLSGGSSIESATCQGTPSPTLLEPPFLPPQTSQKRRDSWLGPEEEKPKPESDDCPKTIGFQQYPLLRLITSLWFALMSKSELVSYLAVFWNQIKSASVLSLPLPFMVFIWGTLSVPRPTRHFWIALIAYVQIVVLIKCFFQFDLWSWNLPYTHNANLGQPFWPPRILGVEKKEKYAIWDLVLLLVLFFHRFMLKSMGLWKDAGDAPSQKKKKRLEEYEARKKAEVEKEIALYELSTTNKESAFAFDLTTVETPVSPVLSTASDDNLTLKALSTSSRAASPVGVPLNKYAQHFQTVKKRFKETADVAIPFFKTKTQSSLGKTRHFWFSILNPSARVSKDIYTWMFLCDFFNFFVVIFGFAAFGTQQGDGGVMAYLEESRVPIPFLAMLVLQFGLILVDRALYLRKHLLGKLMFQLATTLGIHFWMFLVLPAVTERPFNAARPPQIWYMVKCVYLLLSAYQIRSGYPTRILGNFVTKNYNYANNFLFKGFMLVPFLFELRALMDWICTPTTMSLSDWMKLEDIFAQIFKIKCERRAEAAYPQGRGEPKRAVIKYGMGGCFLLIIVGVIWFPLVLFALGNTVGLPSTPDSIHVQFSFGGTNTPAFRANIQSREMFRFNEGDWDKFWYKYQEDRVAQTFLSAYDWQDVGVAQFSINSSIVWDMTPPARLALAKKLLQGTPVDLTLKWTIMRESSGPDMPAEVTDERVLTWDKNTPTSDRQALAGVLNGTQPSVVVKVKHLFPKFVKVTNKGTAAFAWQLAQSTGDEGYGDVFLTLEQNSSSNAVWWRLKEDCSTPRWAWLPYFDQCQALSIYFFSEKMFPSELSFISGGGIIGMYTTFVLVAAKFIRDIFSGMANTIMFEDMPYVDRILQLCLDIYLVRESGELELEEDLFAKLIFLYRSPEMLIKWTRPPARVGSISAASEQFSS